jgi:hypothetical protein
MPARLQNIQEPLEICLLVRKGVHHRVSNPGLCRKMTDTVKAMRFEQRRKDVTVTNVRLHAAVPFPSRKQGVPIPFQGHHVIVVEIVQPNNGMPAIQQSVGQVEPNKAGRTGN